MGELQIAFRYSLANLLFHGGSILLALLIYRSSWMKSRRLQPTISPTENWTFQVRYVFYYIITAGFCAAAMITLLRAVPSKVYLDYSQYSTEYNILSVIVYALGFDAYFYFVHRLFHTDFFYHRIHWVHHRITAPTCLTTVCAHPMELVIYHFYGLIVCYLFPMNYTSILLIHSLFDLGNHVRHLGHEIFSNSIRKKFFFLISATDHDRHHQDAVCNFGHTFSWWDKLYKTERR